MNQSKKKKRKFSMEAIRKKERLMQLDQLHQGSTMKIIKNKKN